MGTLQYEGKSGTGCPPSFIMVQLDQTQTERGTFRKCTTLGCLYILQLWIEYLTKNKGGNTHKLCNATTFDETLWLITKCKFSPKPEPEKPVWGRIHTSRARRTHFFKKRWYRISFCYALYNFVYTKHMFQGAVSRSLAYGWGWALYSMRVKVGPDAPLRL